MKIDINDAVFFGEWDSEEEIEYETISWLEKSSCKFFGTDALLDEYGYGNYQEIVESGYFIPVFKCDCVAMQKEFIANYPDPKIAIMLQEIIDNDNYGYDPGYSVAFRILTQDYPELDNFTQQYRNYEKEKLTQEAKTWCNDNGILWFTDFDPDLKLNLSLYADYGIYCSEEEEFYTDRYLDKKNYYIVDLEDISNCSEYVSIEEALASGRFINYYKQDIIEIQKDFVNQYKNGAFKDKIDKLIAKNKNSSFDDAFNNLNWTNTLSKAWDDFYYPRVNKLAEDWCKENNIEFHYPKDEPNHWGKS